MAPQEAEVKLKINDKETIEKINNLENKAKQLREKFNDCFRKGDTRGLTEVTKELNKVNKEIQNMRTNAANIQAAMKRIDEASPKELHRTIKMINNELNSGRVPRGSKEWKDYCEQLKKVKRELAEVNEEMSDQGSVLDNLKNKFKDWGAAAATGIAAFAGVVMSGKEAVKAYAEMEAEEANVRKFTGMTAEEVKSLNDEFKNIDTRTSRQELNQLAQEAGRLGKQSKEDVLGFVVAANQINVALDDLGEGATLTLSKLTGIFGDEERLGTEKSLLAVGSVINELSQNCSASAPYLAEFSQRMAGVGAQAKMTIPQIMAFAAVLDTQGQNLEASSTALSQLIMKLYQDPAKFAKAAGLEVKGFTELLKKDANEAVLVLLDTLNKMGGMDKLAPVFEEMGTDGARASAVMAALAGNIDAVRQQQVEANIAFNEASSVTKEYEVQNNTVQASLDKAKKKFNELAVDLGEKLLPVMRYAISGSSMLMHVLSVLVDFITKHKTAVITITGALISYNAAIAIHNTRSTIASKLTRMWATTIKVLKGVIAPFKIVVAGLVNTIEYFTNGLQANYTMQQRWQKALKGMSFANWAGVAVTAITAVILIWDKLSGKIDKFKRSMTEAIGKMGEFDVETRKEKEELDKLFGAIRGARKESDTYKKAKDAILSQYGQYLQGLIDERGEIINLEGAYRRLADAIRIANQERGIKNAKDEIESTFLKEMNELSSQLYQTLLDYGCTIQEASRLQAAVVTSMQMGVPVDDATRNRINQLAGSGRQALNGQSGWGTRFKYNSSAALNSLTGGLLGSDFKDDPAAVVNRMFDVTTMRDDAMKQVDMTARINRPLRDLQDNFLELGMKYAETAQSVGGTVMKVNDALSGTFEMVQVTADEAKKIYQEFASEWAYRKGSTTPTASSPNTQNVASAPIGETKKQRQERERREREAAAAEREFQKKLKEQIDDQKAIRDRDEAANIAAYSSGEISYAKFVERKNQIDLDYINNRKKVYENAHRTESDEYAALLKEEEELKAKFLEQQKAMSLREVENEHKSNLNSLAMQFFDPKNPMFQKQKAYNQALLAEDIDYLNKKLALYSAGSDEWERINDQINERLAQDQLDKQKETAEALLTYSKEYQKLDRQSRLAHEESLLKQLHELGLLAEEQYQKALQDIRRKYQTEETEIQKAEIDKRHKEIEDEYQDAKDILANSSDIFGKTMLDMMVSWEKMMSDMANNGEGFWNSFGEFAQSALSVTSAMISQYSAYANAQRDVDLAQIEARYDKEIKAAGKNTKKVEQLEAQKEKDIAATKKKYNDRAMKMEIAQAIAQTAVNAILGYQAGLEFPFPANTFMPAVLAGLATAQGAIQIATLKKQHDAQAAGYYEGGFTGGKKYKKEAGVVHEGEFVANHNAVNNPHLSRLFSLLDYAQRNNTVGSLTAEDVSNALGQGRGVSARGEISAPAPTIVTNSIDTSSLKKLNILLEEGIDARVTIAGEDGFDRKYREFLKMKQNPRR